MPPFRNLRPRTIQERRAADASRNQRSRKLCHTTRKKQSYNVGRYFCETTSSIRYVFENVHVCTHCHAVLFPTEAQGSCCRAGKIKYILIKKRQKFFM
ncbi:hypothetical protein F8M41_000151 [Gigaspora margarita]|uniref:Uncharacterized protein n=1 Tax=Gigaspora margarita TaxID=4874 RepID=A0A8H4ESR0_GIGMA|nr:hypothetical protein F8M41_000151 [Gigaspora margarita]